MTEGKKTDDEINQFIKENSKLLYKQTSNDVGSRVADGGKEKKFTLDGKFTKVPIFYLFFIYIFF